MVAEASEQVQLRIRRKERRRLCKIWGSSPGERAASPNTLRRWRKEEGVTARVSATMDSDVQGAAGSGEEGSGAGLVGHGKEVGV